MDPHDKPQLTRQNAAMNLNKGAGAHLTRQDAKKDLGISAAPKLQRQSATMDVMGRGTSVGQGQMNSMIPKPSPRSAEQNAAANKPGPKPRAKMGGQNEISHKTIENKGRNQGNKAIDTIGVHAAKRIDIVLAAGKSDIHKASTKQLHKDRAFIYDQTKGGIGNKMKNYAADKAYSLVGADDKKEKRTQLILEAKELKSYQKRIKQDNPDGAKREKIASGLKKAKKGAKYVDYVGTGVSFIAPQVGAGIKIGAKATKLAAGAGSAIAYETARKGYQKNVDESATGDAMFKSHIAKEKADMMRNTRNKMAVSTGVSALAAVGSGVLDSALEHASERVASSAQAGYDAGKKLVKREIKKPFKEKIRENKSELVNLMQIQKSRDAYKKRQAEMSHSMMKTIANRKQTGQNK